MPCDKEVEKWLQILGDYLIRMVRLARFILSNWLKVLTLGRGPTFWRRNYFLNFSTPCI